MRYARRPVAVLVLAGVVAAALVGCSSSGQAWPTYSQATDSPQGSEVPSLVSADATDVRLAKSSFGGPTLVSWKSKSGLTRADCKASALTGVPSGGANWWPNTSSPQGWTCGWWKVFEQSGTYYASH